MKHKPQSKKKSYTLEELAEIRQSMGWDEKAFVNPHGDGGLFSAPGVRPDMFSAVPDLTSMAEMLPLLPSNLENELVEILTGQTDDTGDNATTACEAPPVSGDLKVGQIQSVYGEYYKGTNPITITKAGLRKNRADVDRRIINPGSMTVSKFVPDVVNPTNLNTQIGKALWELGYSTKKSMARVLYSGNPATAPASTEKGFIKEYAGFYSLIKTGYTDVVSGNAMPAADSLVIDLSDALDAGSVTTISNAYRTLKEDAELTDFSPTWAISVHPRMRYPLIDIWACNYQTARCSISDNAAARIDSSRITELRDQMLKGNYLLIDGEAVPLIGDFGQEITSTGAAAGEFVGDLLFVPLTSNGRALTYLEYNPYTNEDIQAMLGLGFEEVRVLNNGLYLMTYSRDNLCMSYSIYTTLRLRLETPFLAGRIDNITFTSSTPFRDPYSDSPYYKNGGAYLR